MKFYWNKKYTTIAAYSVIVFVICYGIYKITDGINIPIKNLKKIFESMTPVYIAFFVAYFINPILRWTEKKLLFKMPNKKVKRALGLLISYIFVTGMVIILMYYFIPQIIVSANEIAILINRYIPVVTSWIDKGQIPIFNSKYFIDIIDIPLLSEIYNLDITRMFRSVSSLLTNIAPFLLSYISVFAAGFLNVVLGIIISIYILNSKEKAAATAKKVTLALFPPKVANEIILISKESNDIFTNFLFGKIVDSMIIGFICYIILKLVGIEYAFLLSLIVGITNIIPYFGPFIGGGIGMVILLFINPVQALWYGLIILILQQFDGNILGPRILGVSTGLSSFWVIFSIILFGKLFGVVGMLIGVPTFAVIRNIAKRQIDIFYNRKYPEEKAPQIDNEESQLNKKI